MSTKGLINVVIAVSLLFVGSSAFARGYAWGMGTDNREYCFPAIDGEVVNGASPAADDKCGYYLKLARGTDNRYYCFKAKYSGDLLRNRSYATTRLQRCATEFEWAQNNRGGVSCFPEVDGEVPANIHPVPDRYCD